MKSSLILEIDSIHISLISYCLSLPFVLCLPVPISLPLFLHSIHSFILTSMSTHTHTHTHYPHGVVFSSIVCLSNYLKCHKSKLLMYSVACELFSPNH